MLRFPKSGVRGLPGQGGDSLDPEGLQQNRQTLAQTLERELAGAVNGVDASYLKRAYDIILSSGGIEKFLLDKLGIDDCYIREFRENYLE